MSTNTEIIKRDGQRLYVGELLGAGNLAEVYAIQGNREWVIKLIKAGKDERFIQAEIDAIYALQRLDTVTRRVLPLIEIVTVNGKNALLIERMVEPNFVSLREYARRFSYELEQEKRLWAIAEKYAEFIAAMHTIGYTCNDRKSGDFYYNEKENRLVVLDWNVIERIDQTRSSEGSRQDIKFLGRVWFMLMGGTDEALYDMDTARLERYTVASRAFLWQALNPALRERTFSAAAPGQDLIQEIRGLNELMKMSEWDLESKLRQLIHYQPFETLQAPTPPDLDVALIPYWRIADMLHRVSRIEPSELRQIRTLRTKSRQNINKDIIDTLQVSKLALEKLAHLQSPLSAWWNSYIQQWKVSIEYLIQQAVQAGKNPENLREGISQMHSALLAMSPQQKTSPDKTLHLLYEAHRILVNCQKDALDAPALFEELDKTAKQLEVYRLYLEGQQALYSSSPDKALSFFRQAADYASGLPEKHLTFLPENPAEVVKKLETVQRDESAYIHNIRSQLALGDFNAAINTYESLRITDSMSLLEEKMVARWLTPAYIIRGATSIDEYCHALLILQTLLPYAQKNKGWRDVVVTYLNKTYAMFQIVARDKSSIIGQTKALSLGLLIQQLYFRIKSLPA